MNKDTLPESEHVMKVLKEARKALKNHNAFRLQRLSDQTIHSASVYQHTDYIIIAIIIYALSKVMFHREQIPEKSWNKFVDKMIAALKHAEHALAKNNHNEFMQNLKQAHALFKEIHPDMSSYVEAVLEKASINKASKIHEHGISLGQTAELLGLSIWDLTEYVGQGPAAEAPYALTKDVKQRAQEALEFFS